MTPTDLIAAAVPAQPSTIQVWVPAVLTALATALCGWLVYRNGRRANTTTARASLSDQQLAWTQQAMNEAKEAKVDAKDAMASAATAEAAARTATAAAESATRRAEAAEARLVEVSEIADGLMDWIQRVVRKAHDVDGDQESRAVRELIRVINGGPPEVTSARLRKIRGSGGE